MEMLYSGVTMQADLITDHRNGGVQGLGVVGIIPALAQPAPLRGNRLELRADKVPVQVGLLGRHRIAEIGKIKGLGAKRMANAQNVHLAIPEDML